MMTFSLFPSSSSDASGFAQVLERQLLCRGLVQTDSIESADLSFFWNHPRKLSKANRALRKSQGKKILLRLEPKTVNPLLYTLKAQSIYDLSLNVGGRNSIGCQSTIIHWPYFPHPNPAKPNIETVRSEILEEGIPRTIEKPKTYVLSMIASNKVSWSRPSNYGLRRGLILKRRRLGISAFGMNWSDSPLQRLRRNVRIFAFLLSQGFFPNPIHTIENLFFGRQWDVPEIVDKFEVIGESDFHLVIENSSSYVSEKLLDSMVSGAIPIYMGPDLSEYGIPQDCYILFPPKRQDQLVLLRSLHTVDKNRYREKIRDFLESPLGLKAWTPQSVATKIIDLCL